jgi:hypothetical protein
VALAGDTDTHYILLSSFVVQTLSVHPLWLRQTTVSLNGIFKWDKCLRDEQFVALTMGIKNYVSTHPCTTAGVAKPAATSPRTPNLSLTKCPRSDKQASSPTFSNIISNKHSWEHFTVCHGNKSSFWLITTNYYPVLNTFCMSPFHQIKINCVFITYFLWNINYYK